jgi:ATP-dependent Zn protease
VTGVDRSTAIHEAAHAVTAVVLGRGIKRATIVPHGDSLGAATGRSASWNRP